MIPGSKSGSGFIGAMPFISIFVLLAADGWKIFPDATWNQPPGAWALFIHVPDVEPILDRQRFMAGRKSAHPLDVGLLFGRHG